MHGLKEIVLHAQGIDRLPEDFLIKESAGDQSVLTAGVRRRFQEEIIKKESPSPAVFY